MLSPNAQFYYLDDIFRFVSVTIYVVMGGTEVMRLYLGYLGNLQERVGNVEIIIALKYKNSGEYLNMF